MNTLSLKIDNRLNKRQKFPFFVVDKQGFGYFWIVNGPVKNRRGYYKATFLGNSDFFPFEHIGEIRLSAYKKIERTRVVLNFD